MGIEGQAPFASVSVAGFDGVGNLDDGNSNVYFKGTRANRALKTTPGNVVETNVAADPSGFLPDSNCRTFNYIHKI